MRIVIVEDEIAIREGLEKMIRGNTHHTIIGTCKNGIEGIECFYPSHSKDITDACVRFCKGNDMRITGGCDCHGDFDQSEGFTIGALAISLSMLDLRGIL